MQDTTRSTGSAASETSGSTATDSSIHEIIVVGGGAGGIELVTRLGDTLGKRGRARITLVDKTRTHLWKPLLHVVAAGSMDPSEVERNYLAHAHRHHFNYRVGEMTGLDRGQQLIHVGATYDEEGREVTPMRSLHYDTLVIAVGSVSNDFGTPGVAQYANPLDTAQQAVRFNRRLVNALIHADAQEGGVRSGQLHVAIIGAGATGTELAAELHRTAREVIAYGLDRIDPRRDLRIILIEAADRILPALPERISKAALEILQGIEVEVHTSARVSEVTAEGVKLASGDFIPSELVVWAAGIKAPKFLSNLDGLETNRSNQLVVTPTLQTTRDPKIFAMGDCAACPREGFDSPVPPRAQAAHQEASHLAKQLRRLLDGKQLAPYRYRDFGSLVSFGDYSAVGNLMGFLVGRNLFIEGYFAKLMYRSLQFMHDVALYGVLRASLRWLARGLSHQAEPTVKLH
ncbi:MAG TPA: NAD(P)/FAD-dependent oxidoreductase [Hyphomicrobiales bacterium]|jgi:NADH dehydrogenase